MSRFIRIPVVALMVLGLSGLAFGTESKVEKMQSDESQAQYQRKSITYLGVTFERGVNVPEDYLQVIEKHLRKGIELKRFDYNAVNLSSTYTVEQFVQDLREYVKKRAVDRAAAESEYEARFKRAKVLATDVDRIMNSAYFYIINLVVWRTKASTCPWNPKQAKEAGCVPGTAAMKAVVSATITFYRANLTDESQPPYTKIKTISTGMAEDGYASYEGPPKPPERPSRSKFKLEKLFEQAMKAFERAMEAHRKAVAAYNQRLPQLQKQARLKATANAAASLSVGLSKLMKMIPDFQLKTPVTAALEDGVEFMLGKGEGLGLDDTYDVTEFDAAGKRKVSGYVKVRKIGEAKGTGEGSPSYAEKVKEKRKFVGGEQLYEHPMTGFFAGAFGLAEMTLKGVLGEDEPTVYLGFGGYGMYDIANVFGLPELYVTLGGDVLLLGEDDYGFSYNLIHLMLGLKKKWYMKSLVFTVGLRGGASVYLVDPGETGLEYEGDTVGFGGDLELGLEYYIIPEASLYLTVAGRYFGNPLGAEGAEEAEPELGAAAYLGVFIGF